MKIDVKHDSEYIHNVICENILNIVKYFHAITACVQN